MNRLTDKHNRHINYLRLSVTDRCNLRCVYCMPPTGVTCIAHEQVLRFEEMLAIARCAARIGITKIRITGGEPLVRRGIVELTRQLAQLPGIDDLSMTTNGTLLEEYAAPLADAGLRRINISLDSLDPEKFRRITRVGDIDSVLRGITAVRKAGFNPIKINVVAMRGVNDDEIVDFARLTLDRPVHIRFIEFMPVDNRSSWDHEYFISTTEMIDRISAHAPLEPDTETQVTGPARMYRLTGAAGRIGFISPLSNHFCATCNRLRLTSDGRLRNCLFSDEETDLPTPLRNGCTDAALDQIVRAAVAAKPLRHHVLEPQFQKCSRGMSTIGG